MENKPKRKNKSKKELNALDKALSRHHGSKAKRK
jgi:hypothetical protein